ncbi:hypothetical protein ciss_01340 [Carboxydothermus islandicus]|uniref:Uncharacterized protein n=1 Tax=Carboxydothermus islandicus TaxID=661089 RepID=A0A1L8CZA5_9THEO|nr:hypothetical protein ciss_01340 [Carboxydothermus islandicus]
MKLNLLSKFHITLSKKSKNFISKSQLYFWSKTWQEEERKVSQDIINGKIIKAESLEELFNKLGL